MRTVAVVANQDIDGRTCTSTTQSAAQTRLADHDVADCTFFSTAAPLQVCD